MAGTGAARSVICGGRGGYRFDPGEPRTGLAALGTALAHGSRALELFCGQPLPGPPGPLADTERRRLARQRCAVHQDRTECLALLRRHREARTR